MKWILTKEQLPENDVTVLIYDEFHDSVRIAYKAVHLWVSPIFWQNNSYETGVYENADGGDTCVTHWMPLPDKPTDDFRKLLEEEVGEEIQFVPIDFQRSVTSVKKSGFFLF